MCHTFNASLNTTDLIDWLEIVINRTQGDHHSSYFPLSFIPAIRLNQSGERELVSLQWGLLPFWWKPNARQKSAKAFQRMTFNARSETIHEKPTYREAFKKRRCVIPASNFYEGGQLFRRTDAEFLCLAGLWEQWKSPDGEETIESCTIVTTEANSLVEIYHPKKRMPVILEDQDAITRWLSPDLVERESLESLMQPFPADRMSHERAPEK